MGIGQELMTMKNAIEDAKNKKNQAVGAMDNLERNLKEEHGLTSYEEACIHADELEKKCEEDEENLRIMMVELRENFI